VQLNNLVKKNIGGLRTADVLFLLNAALIVVQEFAEFSILSKQTKGRLWSGFTSNKRGTTFLSLCTAINTNHAHFLLVLKSLLQLEVAQ
jgi:hypothetical protein